jgi:hypothetical protein
MSELFRTYEQEFITGIGVIGKKIESISTLTNRTQVAIKTRRNWPSMISRLTSPTASATSS